VKPPERTPVREDGGTTDNAADGLFEHPVKFCGTALATVYYHDEY